MKSNYNFFLIIALCIWIVNGLMSTVCLANYQETQLLIIANKDFPLEKISQPDLKNIFLGKYKTVSKVQISPLNLKEKSIPRKVFEKHIIKLPPNIIKRILKRYKIMGLGRAPKEFNKVTTLLAYLSKSKTGIGYILSHQLSQVDANQKNFLKILLKLTIRKQP